MQKEQLVVIWTEARRHLEEALPEVSLLMEKKFADIGGIREPGSDLDQLGLSDGAGIVRSYMENNEWGLALEHLCYMVEETNLPISAKTCASIKAAGQVLQMNTRSMRSIEQPCGWGHKIE